MRVIAALRRRTACSFILLIGTLLCCSAHAVDWSQPWREPQDSVAAIKQSDEYAWRLFVALNWPGNTEYREADPTLSFGADVPVVWETWRSTASVFLDDGSDPGPWLNGTVSRSATARFDTPSPQLLGLGDAPIKVLAPPIYPIDVGKPVNETRMNRVNFEFIRAQDLYNLEGQLQHFEQQREISFPLGAKEIKARWRLIDDSERDRYHTVIVAASDGTRKLYGLVALHIASKDAPHWFWATFEHVDNPSQPQGAPWRLPSRDTFACRGAAPDCNRAPTGIGLEGTVWANYRLRGTQTDFTDARGAPTLLANSQIETAGQTSASCITCHARAAIGRSGDRVLHLSPFDTRPPATPGDIVRGYYGAPDSNWFSVGSGTELRKIYLQLDAEWSLLKAHSKIAPR